VENANLEPYRNGNRGNMRRSGDLEHFVGLSVSWVVMQGAAVAESSETPIGEVAKDRS